MNKVMNIKIGDKVTGANPMSKGVPSAYMAMVDNGLYIYCGLPHITPADINQFKEGKYEFNYCGNSGEGLSVVLMKIGRDILELPFNVNLYKDNRFNNFKSNETSIIVQLFNSNTFEIVAIRVLPINERLKAEFVTLWQATVDNKISQSQYDFWLDSEIYSHDLAFNFKNSRQLGYIKHGYSTNEIVLM